MDMFEWDYLLALPKNTRDEERGSSRSAGLPGGAPTSWERDQRARRGRRRDGGRSDAARKIRRSLFIWEALPHHQRPIGVAARAIRRLRALVVEAGDEHYLARAGSPCRRLNLRDQRAGHPMAAERRSHVDVGQLGIRLVALQMWHQPQTRKADRLPVHLA